jgi:kinesin family protein C2/C3
MTKGDQNRSTGATKMNTDSSRSHQLLQIKVQGVNRISKDTTYGKLTLVDLAGSERVSKTDASGERLVEAAAINKSLSALGQVFQAISAGSPHIPFRNSKLTHLLQDSLGGDAKVAVFVNVSPLESNLSETHMTLQFGQNIRKVELGTAKQNKGPPQRLKALPSTKPPKAAHKAKRRSSVQ